MCVLQRTLSHFSRGQETQRLFGQKFVEKSSQHIRRFLWCFQPCEVLPYNNRNSKFLYTRDVVTQPRTCKFLIVDLQEQRQTHPSSYHSLLGKHHPFLLGDHAFSQTRNQVFSAEEIVGEEESPKIYTKDLCLSSRHVQVLFSFGNYIDEHMSCN